MAERHPGTGVGPVAGRPAAGGGVLASMSAGVGALAWLAQVPMRRWASPCLRGTRTRARLAADAREAWRCCGRAALAARWRCWSPGRCRRCCRAGARCRSWRSARSAGALIGCCGGTGRCGAGSEREGGRWRPALAALGEHRAAAWRGLRGRAAAVPAAGRRRAAGLAGPARWSGAGWSQPRCMPACCRSRTLLLQAGAVRGLAHGLPVVEMDAVEDEAESSCSIPTRPCAGPGLPAAPVVERPRWRELYAAARHGRVERALPLLEAGADPHARPRPGARDQRSLPMLAAVLPDLRLLRALIARGVDLNAAHAGDDAAARRHPRQLARPSGSGDDPARQRRRPARRRRRRQHAAAPRRAQLRSRRGRAAARCRRGDRCAQPRRRSARSAPPAPPATGASRASCWNAAPSPNLPAGQPVAARRRRRRRRRSAGVQLLLRHKAQGRRARCARPQRPARSRLRRPCRDHRASPARRRRRRATRAMAKAAPRCWKPRAAAIAAGAGGAVHRRRPTSHASDGQGAQCAAPGLRRGGAVAGAGAARCSSWAWIRAHTDARRPRRDRPRGERRPLDAGGGAGSAYRALPVSMDEDDGAPPDRPPQLLLRERLLEGAAEPQLGGLLPLASAAATSMACCAMPRSADSPARVDWLLRHGANPEARVRSARDAGAGGVGARHGHGIEQRAPAVRARRLAGGRRRTGALPRAPAWLPATRQARRRDVRDGTAGARRRSLCGVAGRRSAAGAGGAPGLAAPAAAAGRAWRRPGRPRQPRHDRAAPGRRARPRRRAQAADRRRRLAGPARAPTARRRWAWRWPPVVATWPHWLDWRGWRLPGRALQPIRPAGGGDRRRRRRGAPPARPRPAGRRHRRQGCSALLRAAGGGHRAVVDAAARARRRPGAWPRTPAPRRCRRR